MSSRPNSEEKLVLQRALSQVGDEYSNPRLVQGELIVHIENIEVLSGDSLIHSNLADGIPADQAPSLHIWSSDIRDFPTQKVLAGSTIDPQPDHIFVDSEYGNRILYWNLNLLEENRDIFTIRRTFRYITFDYRPQVDSVAEHLQWGQIPLEILEQYTCPERFLEQDDALIDTVFLLLANIADPVGQAKVLYEWVQQSMDYVYPPQARGVRNAFETLAGDCGQYSALFITMCRIAGIPARQQSGFNFVPGNTGAHVWSEIYLPVKGWVPVDATRKDGFLHLDNQRLITSMGLNIPLLNTPEWATFNNSEIENGKTDFMQMYTLAANGFKASYGSSRQVIRSVELP